jgi:hypothetical protein
MEEHTARSTLERMNQSGEIAKLELCQDTSNNTPATSWQHHLRLQQWANIFATMLQSVPHGR